jgi:hypothetical protein
MKRPGFMFYPKEWIWDIELRQCSAAARGLWVDLLCLMHEGDPYGHLTAPLELVLRVVGLTGNAYSELTAELESMRVASRTEQGVFYSRRMVRDEMDRAPRAENGKYGGRPRKVAAQAEVRAPAAVVDKPIAMQPAWEEFKQLYPAHRFDEQLACQMFISRGDDAAIVAGLKRAVASDDWLNDGGKFVPWASKFIADGKYAGFKASAPAASQYVPYKPPT